MTHHYHGHHHAGSKTDSTRTLAFATVLNAALVIAEVAAGVLAHSTALLADAAHNFGDVIGLALAWGAQLLSRFRPTERYTYGLRSSSILAALFNAAMVLVMTGAIAWESIRRIGAPGPVSETIVIAVAVVGMLINGFTAWLLEKEQKGDLNIRGAYVHMLGDAAVSLAVVASGVVILLTGWLWVDPAIGLVISAVIVWMSWGLLRGGVDMSLQAVPSAIDPKAVRAYLQALPGVAEVHDLHIWPMSTTETALTCHLVIPGGPPRKDFLGEVGAELLSRFAIQHPTIQVEAGDEACKLAPAHIV
ncbi:MAG: cation diffusion facilitator family transporter [Hyphomicrobiales bacterium]